VFPFARQPHRPRRTHFWHSSENPCQRAPQLGPTISFAPLARRRFGASKLKIPVGDALTRAAQGSANLEQKLTKSGKQI
jgi:hypothetical protein